MFYNKGSIFKRIDKESEHFRAEMDFKDPASLLLKGRPFPGPESELLTESESESRSVVSDSLHPLASTVHGIL